MDRKPDWPESQKQVVMEGGSLGGGLTYTITLEVDDTMYGVYSTVYISSKTFGNVELPRQQPTGDSKKAIDSALIDFLGAQEAEIRRGKNP